MSFFSEIFKKESQLDPINLSVFGADIHSHLIPGIDDGSPDINTTIALIKEMQRLSFKKVITTPHVMSDFYQNSSETILNGLADVRAELKVQNINMDNQKMSVFKFL